MTVQPKLREENKSVGHCRITAFYSDIVNRTSTAIYTYWLNIVCLNDDQMLVNLDCYWLKVHEHMYRYFDTHLQKNPLNTIDIVHNEIEQYSIHLSFRWRIVFSHIFSLLQE